MDTKVGCPHVPGAFFDDLLRGLLDITVKRCLELLEILWRRVICPPRETLDLRDFGRLFRKANKLHGNAIPDFVILSASDAYDVDEACRQLGSFVGVASIPTI